MRVLVDTNIILDAMLEREPFVSDAEALFEAIEQQQIVGFVTATTLTDIFYINYYPRCFGFRRCYYTNLLCA